MTSARKPVKRTPPLSKQTLLKYGLYEEAVQTPQMHADLLALMHADLTGKEARVLREDFSGTYAISSYWVKRHPQNKAICLDLDPEPLAYGDKRARSGLLTPAERNRIDVRLQNVIAVTTPKADMAIACNFSFFVFKERETLVRYFTAVRKSLKAGGTFILELSGGPGMIEETKETKTVVTERYKGRKDLTPMPRRFKYEWHQKKYNPITHEGTYSICFRLPNGRFIKDLFVYDWRVWSIAELRDALMDAGFKSTHCYWDIEKNRRGKDKPLGHHEYARTEVGENYFSWIAQVAGVS